jgi:hypothetical protein
MSEHKLLFVIFCHTSLALLQFPYPKQTFELPYHPSNWTCTVHITVATFANATTSDITERLLTSNREKIIPNLSTMVNRTISIVPVISFFEPCTISVLIDSIVHGSSYVFKGQLLYPYFNGNEYTLRGWRHSIIILIFLSCGYQYNSVNLYLPHRLFYYSVDCGHPDLFPNQAFVPDPMHTLRNVNDSTHNIHNRLLPPSMRRSISTPKYGWSKHDPNIKSDHCSASRWGDVFQMSFCDVNQLAAHLYQLFLNFTAIAKTRDTIHIYGELVTNFKCYDVNNSMLFHALDSTNRRVFYCDRNSDSPRLRPINLSSPFSFGTWVTLGFLFIFCAITISFAIFDIRSNWTTASFIKTIFGSLLELIICLLEKDVEKKNCTKVFIGLIIIGLGNTYKNYLTIDLVFPRAGDAISNLTELINLNFNLLDSVSVKDI